MSENRTRRVQETKKYNISYPIQRPKRENRQNAALFVLLGGRYTKKVEASRRRQSDESRKDTTAFSKLTNDRDSQEAPNDTPTNGPSEKRAPHDDLPLRTRHQGVQDARERGGEGRDGFDEFELGCWVYGATGYSGLFGGGV
jgi:hypothetical protein